MDAACSCELHEFAALQIHQGLAHIGGKRREIDFVIFGQCADDFTQSSSVAMGKNLLSCFVQFQDAFRKKQDAFASQAVDFQPNAGREPGFCVISDFRHKHDELRRAWTREHRI